MRAITPTKFESSGSDGNSPEKHVNDISTYATSVLHVTESGECVPVNTREIAVSEGVEAAATVVQNVVNTQRGELQFNVLRGVPYLETIFSHPDRLMEWETEMREAIESLPFVDAIESFETIVERENVKHRDTQLKVSYKSRIRTNLGEEEEVDLNDGRTIHLHTFPVAPKANWEFQSDPDSTDFEVEVDEGGFILLHITCDKGTTISWDDNDKTAFSVVGETINAVSHTYEKAGTYTIRLGSGIKRFTVERNKIVTKVLRFSSTIRDLSYAFKENTALVEVCEWADQIENISYCYYGCKNLKGVRNPANNSYTIPQFTDSIDYCISAYEGCSSLVCADRTRTDDTDIRYMPPRIHELGFFYNCYYNSSANIRAITLQSWGGTVIDFSDDRYATDFTVGNVSSVAFSVATSLASKYLKYQITSFTLSGLTSLNYKGIGKPSGTGQKGWWYKKLGKCFVCTGNDTWEEVQSYTLTRVTTATNAPVGGYLVNSNSITVYKMNPSTISERDIGENMTYSDSAANYTVSGVSGYRLKLSLGVRRIRVFTTNSVTSVNAYSSLISVLENMFRGCTSLQTACAFTAAAKNVNNIFNGCTSLTTVGGFLGGVFWKNITELKGCFCNCSRLTCGTTDDSIIPAFPAAAKDVSQCYYGCTSLKGISPSLVNSVVTASECFRNCTNIGRKQQKLSWGSTLLNVYYAYSGCTSLGAAYGSAFVIPAWDDVGVKNATGCFAGCTALTCLLPLPPQNRVLRLANCFQGCTGLTLLASSADATGYYKYDRYLMPYDFRVNDSSAAYNDEEVDIMTKGNYVAGCSEAVRDKYIWSWGGNRPNSEEEAMSGNDYTEIFLNTSTREGGKITTVKFGLQFDSTKPYYVTGFDSFPQIFKGYVNHLVLSYDSTQTFGTSARTGVSTCVIRIVTGGNSNLARLTSLTMPAVKREYNCIFANRGAEAPASPLNGDYYISGGRTYLQYNENVIEFPFPFSAGGSNITDSPAWNANLGKYAIVGTKTQLLDMGDVTYSIVNVNRVANSVSNMRNAFIYSESLENICNWPTSLDNCQSCYQFCPSLIGLTEGQVPAWPTNVRLVDNCYYGCTSLLSEGHATLPDFPNATSSAQGCYANCSSITAMPGNWGGVTNAAWTYSNCTSLGSAQTNGSLPYWGNVQNANSCYYNCYTLDVTMPTWKSSAASNASVLLTNVANCFNGCTALNANSEFENYSVAHPAALGGFSGGQNEAKVAQHRNCVANTNAEVMAQFGAEWGGNFQFSAMRIRFNSRKKITGHIGFIVSANDYDTGRGASVNHITGEQGIGNNGNIRLTSSAGGVPADLTGQTSGNGVYEYEDLGDDQKIKMLADIANQPIPGTEIQAQFKRVVVDGEIVVTNSDVFGMWTSANSRNTGQLGTIYGDVKKAKARLPYVYSIVDGKNGCCMVFLPFAFVGQIKLESVSCNHVMALGDYCFRGCTSLTTVDLPSVEYIGSAVFKGCKNLTEVNIERALYIGSETFDGCKKLSVLRMGTINEITKGLLCNMNVLSELEIATDNSTCFIRQEGISKVGKDVTTSCHFGSRTKFETCALGYDKNYLNEIYIPVGIEGFSYSIMRFDGNLQTVNGTLTKVSNPGAIAYNGEYYQNINLWGMSIQGGMTSCKSLSEMRDSGDFYVGTELNVSTCSSMTVIVLLGQRMRFREAFDEIDMAYDENTDTESIPAFSAPLQYAREDGRNWILLNNNGSVTAQSIGSVLATRYNDAASADAGYVDFCMTVATNSKKAGVGSDTVTRTRYFSDLSLLTKDTAGKENGWAYDGTKFVYFKTSTSTSATKITLKNYRAGGDFTTPKTNKGDYYTFSRISAASGAIDVPGHIPQYSNENQVRANPNSWCLKSGNMYHICYDYQGHYVTLTGLRNVSNDASLEQEGDYFTCSMRFAINYTNTDGTISTYYSNQWQDQDFFTIMSNLTAETWIMIYGQTHYRSAIRPLIRVFSDGTCLDNGYYNLHDSTEIGSSIQSNVIYNQICEFFDSGCFYGLINGASSRKPVEIILQGIDLFQESADGSSITPHSNTVAFIQRIFAKCAKKRGMIYITSQSNRKIGTAGKYIKIVDMNNMVMTALQIGRNQTVPIQNDSV